jgi:hypothetical protein
MVVLKIFPAVCQAPADSAHRRPELARRRRARPPRARSGPTPGGLRALSAFHSKPVLYGAFVWRFCSFAQGA